MRARKDDAGKSTNVSQGLGKLPRSRSGLRQANTVVAAAMLVLFLLHGVGNSFEIMGYGSPTSKALARAVAALACAHVGIGIVLTADTLRAQRAAGVSYTAQNLRFWAVRVSGAALAVFIVLHMLIFLQVGGGPYRLREFGGLQLGASVGMVVTIAVHVLCSARPLAVGLGLGAPRSRAADVAFALAALMLLMAVAFVIYFLRWGVV